MGCGRSSGSGVRCFEPRGRLALSRPRVLRAEVGASPLSRLGVRVAKTNFGALGEPRASSVLVAAESCVGTGFTMSRACADSSSSRRPPRRRAEEVPSPRRGGASGALPLLPFPVAVAFAAAEPLAGSSTSSCWTWRSCREAQAPILDHGTAGPLTALLSREGINGGFPGLWPGISLPGRKLEHHPKWPVGRPNCCPFIAEPASVEHSMVHCRLPLLAPGTQDQDPIGVSLEL